MGKDLFSQQAAAYAKYRPAYPPALFEYIASFVPVRHSVWDCATGNGQAALALAQWFDKVYATDHSESQLSKAVEHPRIIYSIAAAEGSSFPDNSFDCITVAQAYHWFDFTAFHREAKRVGKPGAVVAIWGYSLIQSDIPSLQTVIDSFYRGKTGPYWDEERKYVDDQYSTLPFLFEPLPTKDFRIEVSWSREYLLGYLNTWSSVQHFIKANGYNPVQELAGLLAEVWPGDAVLSFYFPVFLRLGRIPV